jgi:outer membrane immunogenic protein
MGATFSTGDNMKKLLLGTAMSLVMAAGAAAADLMPAPAYTKAPPPPMPMWTGFYLGIEGGTGWGTTADTFTASQFPGGPLLTTTPVGPFQSSFGLNGFHGGGTAGWNWQHGPVVLGIEGDISAADINGTGDCTQVFGNFSGCRTKLTGFGTLTGRLGIAIDHALVYIKGGGAWAHFDHSVLTSSLTAASIGDNRSGFTVGTGIEYAFWHGWSAKVEYDLYGLWYQESDLPLCDQRWCAGSEHLCRRPRAGPRGQGGLELSLQLVGRTDLLIVVLDKQGSFSVRGSDQWLSH